MLKRYVGYQELYLHWKTPNSGMIKQAMNQLQNKDTAQWNTTELVAVYSMLATGLGEDGFYLELLNEMNARALQLVQQMGPGAISEILGALFKLRHKEALPLVIALCKQSVHHVPNFADPELIVVLSALLHYGHSDHFLVEALERHVPKVAFTAHAETVTKVMQFFRRWRILSPPVFNTVAESFCVSCRGVLNVAGVTTDSCTGSFGIPATRCW